MISQGPHLASASKTAVGGPPPQPPRLILRARPGWHVVSLGELWQYRALLGSLVVRDLKVRYKQAFFEITKLDPQATWQRSSDELKQALPLCRIRYSDPHYPG